MKICVGSEDVAAEGGNERARLCGIDTNANFQGLARW